MTPCPCRLRPTHLSCPLWTSPLLSCLWPWSLLDCYVAASVSPPSLNTWKHPQRCRRSRGMFLTPSCQAAKTQTNHQHPKSLVRLDRTAMCSPLHYVLFPTIKPHLSCPDAAVERRVLHLLRHWGFKLPPVSDIPTPRRPHVLLRFSIPSHPVQRRDYSLWNMSQQYAHKHIYISMCATQSLELKATQTASQRGSMSRTTYVSHFKNCLLSLWIRTATFRTESRKIYSFCLQLNLFS